MVIDWAISEQWGKLTSNNSSLLGLALSWRDSSAAFLNAAEGIFDLVKRGEMGQSERIVETRAEDDGRRVPKLDGGKTSVWNEGEDELMGLPLS